MNPFDIDPETDYSYFRDSFYPRSQYTSNVEQTLYPFFYHTHVE